MFVRLLPVGGTQGLSKDTSLLHFPPLSLAPSPLICSLPSSIASCSVGYLALLAQPYLHFSALVPWPKASPLPPPPALLQLGQGQCSLPAGCEHGGESWQEPEWITDDRWPTDGRRGIPALLKRNTYPMANAGVGF